MASLLTQSELRLAADTEAHQNIRSSIERANDQLCTRVAEFH